jgi:hypothetical protein
MASNFSSLRSSRESLLGKVTNAAKQETAKAGADDRFWKLTVDQKTGRGYAQIRFLPPPPNEELPWVRFYQHNFKGATGAWLVENCLTTLGQRSCPICKDNSRLWNLGDDANQKIARDRKRKQQFICNILVEDDKAHPENNGKVFLFKYGVKIQDKILDAIEPKYPDQTPFNPFDLWEGASFKLKAEKKDGFQNYDKSEFTDIAQCAGDLEKIWQAEYKLQPFVEEAQFKSFEQLEGRLKAVVSGERPGAAKTATEAIDYETEELESIAKEVDEQEKKAPVRRARTIDVPTTVPAVAEDDEDDEAKLTAFFKGVGVAAAK